MGRLIALPLSTPPEIGALGGVGLGGGGGGGSSAIFTLVGPATSPVPVPGPEAIGAAAFESELPTTVVTPRLTGGMLLAFADTSFGTSSVLLTSDIRIIKERHVCLEVASGAARFSALGWSRAGILWTELCQKLELTAETSIDIAYKLRAKSNSWYTGLDLELVDLRRAAPL